MARFRKIDPRVWNDEKFRALSDDGKLGFLFLLTHPHMTALGAMRATLDGLATELGWKRRRFSNAIGPAITSTMVEYDATASMMWMPNFLKYNAPESPNVVKAWVAAADLLPECALKDKAIASAKAIAEGMQKAFAEAFNEAFAKTMPNQEQEQEQEPKSLPAAGAAGVRGDAAAPAEPPARKLNGASHAMPNCPHEQLIALFHKTLPMLPEVRGWNETRQGHMRARWKEQARPHPVGAGYTTESGGLHWWRQFFEHVGRSKWLTGRVPGRDGRPPFFADLAWLIMPENFLKVIEGKYDDVQ